MCRPLCAIMRKQPDGLQCDRLAACVRSGDDQRPVMLCRPRYVDRNRFFPVQQRMPCLFEVQHPMPPFICSALRPASCTESFPFANITSRAISSSLDLFSRSWKCSATLEDSSARIRSDLRAAPSSSSCPQLVVQRQRSPAAQRIIVAPLADWSWTMPWH